MKYSNQICPKCNNGNYVVLLSSLGVDATRYSHKCLNCGYYFKPEDIEEIKPSRPGYFGKTTITVRFENRIEWQKWRKYVLKTDWDFDGGSGPYIATMDMRFSCTDDVEKIVKTIVNLLQMGFDIYSAKWTLEKPGDPEIIYKNNDDGSIEKIVIQPDKKEQ